MESLKLQETLTSAEKRVDAYVAPISPEMKLDAFRITQELRNSGISTDVELAGRKLKKILSFANNSGAHFVVLVGARELENGEVTIKDMESGDQEQVPRENVSDILLNRIKG